MINQIIWIFREPRSGGTWFTERLALKYNRRLNFLDDQLSNVPLDISKKNFFLNRVQQENDKDAILNTHNFFALESLKNYQNPIVIRISRKNKVEQFISGYIAEMLKNKFLNIDKVEQLKSFPKIDKFFIDKKRMDFFIQHCKELDILWNTYSNPYRTEVVYYEDLLNSYSSDLLGIHNWSMQDNDVQPTYKIPYSKNELVINFNSVRSYLEQSL